MADLQEVVANAVDKGDSVSIRTGVVAAMGSPMTVTVQTTNIPCGLIDGGGYFPRVGDTVAIIGQGDSWICVGPIRPTGRSARYGVDAQRGLSVQVFGSGVTTSYIWDILTDPYGFVPGGTGSSNIVIPTGGTGLYGFRGAGEFAGSGGFNFVQFTGIALAYRSVFNGGTDAGIGGVALLTAGTTITFQGSQNSGINQGTIASVQFWRVG